MNTTETTTTLDTFLAAAPGRGMTVIRTSGTTYDLVDAYGDGTTDEHVTVTHPNGVDIYTVTIG